MGTDNESTPDHATHDIAPGIRLVVDRKLTADCDGESRIIKLVSMCTLLAYGRDAARARIKECIAQLAAIDEARGGNEEGLVSMSEALGWISNYRTHTTDDYRRVLTALVDLVDDEDLARAYEEAEFQVKRAMEGGAS